MKYLVLATVLFLVGVGLTQIERPHQSFSPLVRVRTENGLFMTLVQKQVPGKTLCDAVVDKVVEQFGRTCPTCTVESTDCASKLEGIDQALALNQPVPVYVVSSDDIRIGILGPPNSVQARCEGMASFMLRAGVKSAACVPPAGPS